MQHTHWLVSWSIKLYPKETTYISLIFKANLEIWYSVFGVTKSQLLNIKYIAYTIWIEKHATLIMNKITGTLLQMFILVGSTGDKMDSVACLKTVDPEMTNGQSLCILILWWCLTPPHTSYPLAFEVQSHWCTFCFQWSYNLFHCWKFNMKLEIPALIYCIFKNFSKHAQQWKRMQ